MKKICLLYYICVCIFVSCILFVSGIYWFFSIGFSIIFTAINLLYAPPLHGVFPSVSCHICFNVSFTYLVLFTPFINTILGSVYSACSTIVGRCLLASSWYSSCVFAVGSSVSIMCMCISDVFGSVHILSIICCIGFISESQISFMLSILSCL